MQVPSSQTAFVFYMVASTLPFHLFAYIPFWDYLRFSKKATLFTLLAEQLVFTYIYFLLYYAGASARYAQLIFVPLFGTLFFCLVKMEPGKIAFLYIFTAAYVMFVRGAVSFVAVSLLHLPPCGWEAGTGVLLLFFATMPIMVHYINSTAQLVFQTDAPGFWKTLWLLPFFNTLTVFLFTFPLENGSFLSLLARTLLMVCILLIYHFLIRSIRQMQNQAIAEERSRSMEFLLQAQSEQYAFIQAQVEETRRARHDMRYHWKALQSYSQNGDYDALSAYIQKYTESMPQSPYCQFCSNPAVNAILAYYAQKASRQQIKMDITFPIKEPCIIPEPDLCAILGNLLETALDACLSLENRRLVQVNAKQLGDSTLMLTVDYTCAKPPFEHEPDDFKNQHKSGLGIESVHAAAKRYHGDARFEWRDGMLFASIMMNRKMEYRNGHRPKDVENIMESGTGGK